MGSGSRPMVRPFHLRVSAVLNLPLVPQGSPVASTVEHWETAPKFSFEFPGVLIPKSRKG